MRLSKFRRTRRREKIKNVTVHTCGFLHTNPNQNPGLPTKTFSSSPTKIIITPSLFFEEFTFHPIRTNTFSAEKTKKSLLLQEYNSVGVYRRRHRPKPLLCCMDEMGVFFVPKKNGEKIVLIRRFTSMIPLRLA